MFLQSGGMAVLCVAAMATAWPALPARADTSGVLEGQRYDIAAQDLETALLTFSRESGIDIVYDRVVLQGRRSAALAGTFAPPVALATLLSASGLAHRFTSATAVLILQRGGMRAADAPGREGGGSAGAPQITLDRLRVTATPRIGMTRTDYRPFGQIVQRAIMRQLQAAPQTQTRRFQTRLAVRLDPQGVIRQLIVERSTGHVALDREIVLLLEGATMPESPPVGMPQPIWFEIVAR